MAGFVATGKLLMSALQYSIADQNLYIFIYYFLKIVLNILYY